MTPRRALHFAAIAMAVDSHCADKCSGCQGHGRLYRGAVTAEVVCAYCHGFGRRELNAVERRDMNIGAQMQAMVNREVEATMLYGALPP